MKKILFLSILIASSALMTSCTADSIADTTPSHSGTNADDTGGQNGQIPPPPPPPPPPGVGTGL